MAPNQDNSPPISSIDQAQLEQQNPRDEVNASSYENHTQTSCSEETVKLGSPNGYSRFNPRLHFPAFDGQPDTWEPFITQFRLTVSRFQWDDKVSQKQLVSALYGEARWYMSNLPPYIIHDTFRLTRCLEHRFGQCSPAERYRASLYNVKKIYTETVVQYGARVNLLMARAYPGIQGSSMFDTLAIKYFLQGLPDQSLEYEIHLKKPRNLGEAMAMVNRHEICRQSTGRFSGTRHTT